MHKTYQFIHEHVPTTPVRPVQGHDGRSSSQQHLLEGRGWPVTLILTTPPSAQVILAS